MSKRTRKRPSKPYLGKGYRLLGKARYHSSVLLHLEDPCVGVELAQDYKVSFDFCGYVGTNKVCQNTVSV